MSQTNQGPLVQWVVTFKDGGLFSFDGADCIIAATEYAQYRSQMRGSEAVKVQRANYEKLRGVQSWVN